MNCIAIDESSITDLSFWRDTLGFDFDTIWKMPKNGNSPILNGQNEDDYNIKDVIIHFPISNTATQVNAQWGGDLFKQPSTVFNSDLAIVCSALSSAAYNGTCDVHNNTTKGHYIEEAYRELGFIDDRIKLFSYPGHPKNQLEYAGIDAGDDDLAFAIGDMPIKVDGKDYNLILITLRESVSTIDWLRDLTATGIGKGFCAADS